MAKIVAKRHFRGAQARKLDTLDIKIPRELNDTLGQVETLEQSLAELRVDSENAYPLGLWEYGAFRTIDGLSILCVHMHASLFGIFAITERETSIPKSYQDALGLKWQDLNRKLPESKLKERASG
jgi:hypothetical protein